MRDERFDAHNYFDDRSLPVPPPRPGPVRRDPRRPHRPRPHLLLRELRAAGHPALDHQNLLGARRGGPGRRFLGLGPDLRSAHHRSDDRLVPAVRGQPDPGGPPRPHRRRVPRERAPADGRRAVPEPDLGRAAGQGRAPVQRARRPRPAEADHLFLRLSTFDADEIQPFGTGVQQESLVPGFAAHPRHHDPQRRGQLHQGDRPEQAERAPLRLHVGERRAAQPETRGSTSRSGSACSG